MKLNKIDKIYEFVFRGLLTEEALDNAGRTPYLDEDLEIRKISEFLSINELDEGHVSNAKRMALVYTVIAAFENSVRELISSTLLSEVGENWWNECVSNPVRTKAEKKMEDEQKNRWHSQRGDDPINYTMLPDLLKILNYEDNFEKFFQPFIPTFEWAKGIFDSIERTRNVVMHSGYLDDQDISRLGTFVRDWTRQVAI